MHHKPKQGFKHKEFKKQGDSMVQSATLIMAGTSLRPTKARGRGGEEDDSDDNDDCLVDANHQHTIKRNTSNECHRHPNTSSCLSAGRCVDNWYVARVWLVGC
jgi:hypothetical protein